MAKTSAGILLFRRDPLALLIVHPGGPFWARKDAGAWSLPKGELESPDEDPRARALAELAEETGMTPPAAAELLELGSVRLASGKRIVAFAAEGDFDPAELVSNTFELEWPPRSGRLQTFPEIDRACWASPTEARRLLNPAQEPLVDRLAEALSDGAA